jgi:hypothetical protein
VLPVQLSPTQTLKKQVLKDKIQEKSVLDRQSTQVPPSSGFMSALTSAANRMTVNTGAKKDQAMAKETAASQGGNSELPKEMEK